MLGELTDQEEKDRYERKKLLRDRKRKPAKEDDGHQSTAHHARMYRYHDQVARALSSAIKKSGNRELKRQYDHHVARCKHHEGHL